jgi:hypothetical protein
MPEVGAVYDTTLARRIPADVFPTIDNERARARRGPVAKNKRLTASVVARAAQVVTQVFDEAERRLRPGCNATRQRCSREGRPLSPA